MEFNEDQLVDLQTRLAYQEDTLSRLNDVVTTQQAELAALRNLVRDLLRTIGEDRAGSANPGSVEERPPHY